MAAPSTFAQQIRQIGAGLAVALIAFAAWLAFCIIALPNIPDAATLQEIPKDCIRPPSFSGPDAAQRAGALADYCNHPDRWPPPVTLVAHDPKPAVPPPKPGVEWRSPRIPEVQA